MNMTKFIFFRMNPKLLIMSLLCSACTINSQGTDSTNTIAKKSPKPTATFASTSRFSETQADGEISVGNIQASMFSYLSSNKP